MWYRLADHVTFTFRPAAEDGFFVDLRDGTIFHVNRSGTTVLRYTLDNPSSPRESTEDGPFLAGLANRGWLVKTPDSTVSG